jgi:dTDP-4-dehydrorhamnose 3,5-epimerase
MEIVKTSIEGLVIIQPKVFEDERGYFMESYKEFFIKENFPDINFIQDNESKSSYGVLRGLHFQKPPFEQTKLVRVIEGEVLDVAVDLRKESSTYGKWESVVLSGDNKKQFFIPKGFAHGFVVLSKEAIFFYKVDNTYAHDYDSGIYYGDENLNIDWIIPRSDLIISKKDINLQSFKQHKRLKQ